VPTNEQKQEKYKVQVHAPPEGKWAGGVKWDKGITDAEVTEEQLVTMGARDDIRVYLNGKRVRSSGPVSEAGTTERLTPDEVLVLREYRSEKTRNPKLAEKGQQAKPFELVDEKDAPTSFESSEATPAATPPKAGVVTDDRSNEPHPRKK
jgi:hypothetical protein